MKPPHKELQITCRTIGGEHHIFLSGKVSFTHSRAINLAVFTAAQNNSINEISIDCSDVSQIDSSGVGLLKAIIDYGSRHRKKIEITNPSKMIRLIGALL